MNRPALPARGRRQRATIAASVTATLLLVLLCTDARSAEPDLSWIDRDAIAAREVLVYAERSDRPLVVEVKIAAEIAAPANAIWDVLKACEIAPEFVPDVQSCRRLEQLDGGRADLFVQTVKPAFFMPAFEHVFRLDYTPFSRIDVHRVSGPISFMEGSWWLLPQASGRILLVYELALDPGWPIPRFLVRSTLKRDLPRLVAAVRDRAETAPKP